MSLASRRARRRLVPLARPPTHERASTQGRKIAAGAHDRPHAASYCCAQVGDSHQAEESEAQAALAMTLWDASGRVKIERAKEHISQLDIASREFFDTNPYEVRFEPDKHEMLTLTVGTFRSLLIKAFPDTTIYMRPEDFLSPVEDGAVMSRLAADITTIPVDMHHEFVFEVTFAEGEILEGEAVLPTL